MKKEKLYKTSNKKTVILLSLLVVALIIGIIIEFKLLFFNSNTNSEQSNDQIESIDDYVDISHTHFDEVLDLNLATKHLNVANEENPIILFASDYQGDYRYDSAYKILHRVKEYIKPNLFVMCGDYQVTKEDNFGYSELGILELSDMFTQNFDSSIPQLYVQGNHDALEANGIAEDGIYESDKYIIYVINRDSFPNNQTEEPDQKETVIATSQKLRKDLQSLVDRNVHKPIFIATHVPLHYTVRNDGGDNAYASYIIDVLNEYGKKLDLIYLFGHNHSGTYDDYIGGSINYLEHGSMMKIGGSNEPININFTYLNAGYIGYANNSVSDKSTKKTSATAITVSSNNLLIQKYTKYGKYYTEPIIINLNNK